jgi:xanthine dehydrogenase accessory factor
MTRLVDEIRSAKQRLVLGEKGMLVRVEATSGSAPRDRDAAMLVFAYDSIGTIGGGALEHGAINRARAALMANQPAPDNETIPLGPAIGQCCGGSVRLRYSMVDAGNAAPLDQWLEALEAGRGVLWLFGAGHVGQAVVRALEPLDIDVTWVDSRPGVAGGLGEDLPIVTARAPHLEVASIPSDSMVLVMTHSHAQDFDIVHAALGRADLPFVGLIGSATKRARFLSRLKARGHGGHALSRLVCPIGVEGISGKQPAVIAASVAAQILRYREQALADRGVPMSLSG